MSWVKRIYPFNAEQTVNIASEFGPLVALFVVNAITGNVEDGTWALIVTTVIAVIAMLVVLKRLPIFPLIASSVTVIFGILTLVTHNPMWVQIHYTQKGWDQFTWSFAWFFVVTAVLNELVRLVYAPGQMYNLFGFTMDGVNVWILFKVALIMPASGLYAWFLTRLMQKHAIPAPAAERKDVVATATTGVPVAHKKAAPDATPVG